MNRVKHFFSLLLCSFLVLSLFGCADSNEIEIENIELIEPTGVKIQYVEAGYQDMFEGAIFSGKVVPVVSEVSFSSNQNFLKYGVLPGSYAKKNSVIVYASTTAIDEKIKLQKESMDSQLENYTETVKDLTKSLDEANSKLPDYKRVRDILLSDEYTNEDGSFKAESGYNYGLYVSQIADYANCVATIQNLEQQLNKTNSLYELDSSYNALLLKRLEEQKKEVLATAKNDGYVVGINYYGKGDYINKDKNVAAIGDVNTLQFATEYISKYDLNKASYYYALVNGKKYDVEMVELDKDLIAKTNSETYSLFNFYDPEGEIKVGDYVAIVLVTTDKKNVLTVPKNAISKADGESYVYVTDGETSTYTPIKTGITSGSFVEVISGLNEGDKVLCEQKLKTGSKTATLSKGSFGHEFKESGYLFYPKREWITNQVEYGTTYVQSIDVKRYERVVKGQTVATIKVIPDSISLKRKERSLLRAQEDLNRYLEDNKQKIEEKDEKILKVVNQKTDYIKDLEELIEKIKKDSITTEIKAPFNGIITDVRNMESGSILWYESGIVEISSEEDSFVVVEDNTKQLSYGLETLIEYSDAEGKDRTAVGKVVTVFQNILSDDLKTGYALIQVAPEDLELMAGSASGYEGWWNRSRFTITTNSRKMDNVVVVPKSAVTLDGQATYVTVLDENKKPKLVSFIAGGSDYFNYWVVEGLTEGTEICLE